MVASLLAVILSVSAIRLIRFSKHRLSAGKAFQDNTIHKNLTCVRVHIEITYSTTEMSFRWLLVRRSAFYDLKGRYGRVVALHGMPKENFTSHLVLQLIDLILGLRLAG